MPTTPSTWHVCRTAALLTALMSASSSGFAGSGWINQHGQAIPDTDNAKSSQNFSASILVTSDKDWQQKWNTSSSTTPNFTTATEVSVGGTLFILTFLANPKLDSAGITDVSCDFSVSRPDGSSSVKQVDIPCFKVRLTTPPTLVYMSPAGMQFVAEAADPKGVWSVDITVRDRLRGVSLPLHSEFSVR